MNLDIEQEQAALRQSTVPQLRARYQELCGEPPRSSHRQHLLRRILWRMQALAEGDLSERARQRAADLANDADLRIRAPRDLQIARHDTAESQPAKSKPARDRRLPAPGTILVRGYRRQTLQVKVLAQGFEYDGRLYGSLTAVAREITGQHWNGFHFFGLTEESL